MERTAEKREARVQNSFNRKRTAAYVRVSGGKETMLESLAAQVDCCSGYIRNNPVWEYAGITRTRRGPAPGTNVRISSGCCPTAGQGRVT